MARIRSVHPSIFTDEAWVSCSPLARILYVGLWTDADDQGLFEWKPLQIKMRLLPADAADVSALLDELVAVSLIARFDHGGKAFGAIKDFRKYQRPKKPNAIHFMPPEWVTYVGLTGDDVAQPAPSEPVSSEPVPHQFPTSGEKSPQMEDGGGSKGIGAKAPRRTSPDKPVVWSPQFEESYAHYPDEMKRSKSRAACWPIWQAAASKAGGEGALAGAVRRYRAEDKQHKGESKAPAFDRWLRDGRWEHWLEIRVTTAEARWTGPPEIRARVAMEQTDAFARSYLDPAEWTPDGIRPANGYAFDKLRHLRSLKDVKLLQPQERAA